jgi:Uma2 family endonuclease
MNTPLRPASLSISTRAAEGLDRRRWSVAEIEAMVEAGILLEDERFELIGGEIVPMSPKGIHHEVLKAHLTRYWSKRAPDHIMIIQETTFRISLDTFVEPDFVFYPMSVGVRGLSPKTALLAVEVADSSLSYDRGRKAKLYASFGVVELWVIDAVKLKTRIFTEPAPEGYGKSRDLGPADPLTPSFAPELSVTLAELELN